MEPRNGCRVPGASRDTPRAGAAGVCGARSRRLGSPRFGDEFSISRAAKCPPTMGPNYGTARATEGRQFADLRGQHSAHRPASFLWTPQLEPILLRTRCLRLMGTAPCPLSQLPSSRHSGPGAHQCPLRVAPTPTNPLLSPCAPSLLGSRPGRCLPTGPSCTASASSSLTGLTHPLGRKSQELPATLQLR